jgi:peptidoglycan hydrolase-like protein with peptidoglycan-binding domain
MILAYLTLITALSISAVAIYYSVAGLVAIFAAAAVPIMIMGGTLEIAKLVTAVWLHKNWERATSWIKAYLVTAVVVLMFITSMGIFGFLSKAHIEQTASATESTAQITRLEAEIARNEEIISRAETKIKDLETSGTGATTQIQSQIDKEQERIDGAYTRIQPAIDEQKELLAQNLKPYEDQVASINAKLALLQTYMEQGKTRDLQRLVGASADGRYGSGTAKKVEAFRSDNERARDQVLFKMQSLRDDTSAAIAKLRAVADSEIADSNALITNLRKQLQSNGDSNNIQTALDEQATRIKTATAEVDRLLEEKFSLEGEYRKLEAEVGPIKYIAEFVYGEEANQNLLEKAVTWVIVTIIFVFDPLAVLLLIAAQYTFEYRKNPIKIHNGQRIIEKTVEVEKVVEVPVEVEKIVEVEKVVEVPVETIVEKEVEVEKIVEVEKEVEKIVEVEVPTEVTKVVEIEVPVVPDNYTNGKASGLTAVLQEKQGQLLRRQQELDEKDRIIESLKEELSKK